MILSNYLVLRVLKYAKIFSIEITTFRAHNNSKCFHFRFRFLSSSTSLVFVLNPEVDSAVFVHEAEGERSTAVEWGKAFSFSERASFGCCRRRRRRGPVGSMYRVYIRASERCECKEENYTHHNKFS